MASSLIKSDKLFKIAARIRQQLLLSKCNNKLCRFLMFKLKKKRKLNNLLNNSHLLPVMLVQDRDQLIICLDKSLASQSKIKLMPLFQWMINNSCKISSSHSIKIVVSGRFKEHYPQLWLDKNKSQPQLFQNKSKALKLSSRNKFNRNKKKIKSQLFLMRVLLN